MALDTSYIQGESAWHKERRLARETAQVDATWRPGESFAQYDRRRRLASGEIAAGSLEALSEADRLTLAQIRQEIKEGNCREIPSRLRPFVNDLLGASPDEIAASKQETSRDFLATTHALDVAQPTTIRTLATDQAEYRARLQKTPPSHALQQAMGGFRQMRSEMLDASAKRLGMNMTQRLAICAEARDRGMLIDEEEATPYPPQMSDALADALLGQSVPMSERRFHARCTALGYDAVHSMALMIEAYQFGKICPDDEDTGERAQSITPPPGPRTMSAVGKKPYAVPGRIQAASENGVCAYDRTSISFDAPRPREQKRSALYVC
jgi:hypothetical protein